MATISLSRTACDLSAAKGESDYAAAVASVLGRRGVFTTYEGVRLVGTVEAPTRHSSGFPILRFADGKWGRCDDQIELVD